MKTCCFTGPRTYKLGFPLGESDPLCVRLKENIYSEAEALYNKGFKKFISGMAEGVDTFAAEAVISLKEKYNDIILVAALPFDHKGSDRSEEEKKRLERNLSHADEIVLVEKAYKQGCYYKRNRYMVDNSDLLFAVYSNRGGTAYTINYAKSVNKPIRICP